MNYRTCPGIILTSVGEDYYLVTHNSRTQINETAAFYWTQMSEGTDIPGLVNATVLEYDIEDPAVLEQEINEFVIGLLKGHLIEQIPEQNG